MVKGYTIRIESDMLQKIHAVAAYDGRSTNSQILILIRDCINRFEKEHGVIDIDSKLDSTAKVGKNKKSPSV